MYLTATTAYLYKWVHLPTGKWYIGSRTAQGCHPDDGYICSSKTVKPLILENAQAWRREILCLGDPEYILNLEADVLIMLDAKNDHQSYNLHNGDGKFTTRGTIPWNKGGGKPTGKPAWNSGLTKETNATIAALAAKKVGKPAPNKGVPMSEEQKIKMSLVTKGRASPKKGKPGKPHSIESKEKVSAALRGKKQSTEHIAKRAASRLGKKNPNVSPMKGRPKPKVVCRIQDKREMTSANFIQWARLEDLKTKGT